MTNVSSQPVIPLDVKYPSPTQSLALSLLRMESIIMDQSIAPTNDISSSCMIPLTLSTSFVSDAICDEILGEDGKARKVHSDIRS